MVMWQSTAVCHLREQWRLGGDHFPCYVGDRFELASRARIDPESFTAVVIASLLVEHGFAADLVTAITDMVGQLIEESSLIHFFKRRDLLPADVDCTAYGYLLLARCTKIDTMHVHIVLDKLIANVTDAGITATYFIDEGPRANIVDIGVCVNALRLACLFGREEELAKTWLFLIDVLTRETYVGGSRYYPSEDCFLYFMSRLLRDLPKPRPDLKAILRLALQRRIGTTMSPLDLAQRIIAARNVGLSATEDADNLAKQITAGGWWAADGWFCYGRSRRLLGSSALTTAFALSALSE